MTNQEKLNKIDDIVKKGLSRKDKNQYSQDTDKRNKVDSGYSDCSGFTRFCYLKTTGIDIGINTEVQIKSSKLKTVDIKIDSNGIPDVSKLQKADLLYFRGNDTSRTKGVGHVEMYIGNGKLLGHGSGIGPSEKHVNSYCKMRHDLKSKNGNRGLICVRRMYEIDEVKPKEPKKEPTKTDYSTALKGYVGNSIVDAFKSKKIDSSFATRKKYATAVGMKDYKGLQNENEKLLKLLGATVK